MMSPEQDMRQEVRRKKQPRMVRLEPLFIGLGLLLFVPLSFVCVLHTQLNNFPQEQNYVKHLHDEEEEITNPPHLWDKRFNGEQEQEEQEQERRKMTLVEGGSDGGLLQRTVMATTSTTSCVKYHDTYSNETILILEDETHNEANDNVPLRTTRTSSQIQVVIVYFHTNEKGGGEWQWWFPTTPLNISGDGHGRGKTSPLTFLLGDWSPNHDASPWSLAQRLVLTHPSSLPVVAHSLPMEEEEVQDNNKDDDSKRIIMNKARVPLQAQESWTLLSHMPRFGNTMNGDDNYHKQRQFPFQSRNMRDAAPLDGENDDGYIVTYLLRLQSKPQTGDENGGIWLTQTRVYEQLMLSGDGGVAIETLGQLSLLATMSLAVAHLSSVQQSKTVTA